MTAAFFATQDITPVGLPSFDATRPPEAILLTGATGFLGRLLP